MKKFYVITVRLFLFEYIVSREMNSAVKSGSLSLPPLRSAERRTFDEKNPVEVLPHMIDKLSIDESKAKRNITISKLNQNSITQEEILERNSKTTTASLYDIDGMSSEELQASLCRIMENPCQPFSFLANISNAFANDKQFSMKPTEIDMQLAAVAKRIESSKLLLQNVKSQIDDMYLRAKQNDIRLWKVDDVCDDKLKEEQLS